MKFEGRYYDSLEALKEFPHRYRRWKKQTMWENIRTTLGTTIVIVGMCSDSMALIAAALIVLAYVAVKK